MDALLSPDRLSAPTATKAVCDHLRLAGRISLVRTRDASQAFFLGQALFQAGIEVVEVSYTVPDAPAVIEKLCKLNAGLVGAGTVLTAAQATDALAAGARFLVAPIAPPHLVPLAHEAGAAAIVGALTPTEIMAVWSARADFVKVFPVRAMGGPTYIRDILAPLVGVSLLVSGGVDASNYREYLSAGAAIAMLGSQLVPAALIDAGDWGAVVEAVKTKLAGAP